MTNPILIILALAYLPVHGQIEYDSKTNSFLCPSLDRRYCAAGSGHGSSIISCTSAGTAEISSCHVELADILPVGYERAAVCYESPYHPGDAVCAFNGTGYTPSGLEVSIPETVLCDGITVMRPLSDIDNDEMLGVDETGDRSQSGSLAPVPPFGSPSLEYTPPAHLHTAAALDLSLSLPLPSTAQPASSGVGEIRDVVCSNPWARDTRTGDVLTLDIVLVVPTTRVRISETQVQPSSSSVVLTTGFTRASSALIRPASNIGQHGTVMSISATATSLVTSITGLPAGSSSPNGSGVLGGGLSNDVESLHIKTVVVTVVLTLVLWACVLLRCF